MTFKLDFGAWGGIIPIPSSVIKYFPEASGDRLKFLIYFIFRSGEEVPFGEIVKDTGIAVDKIREAADFWRERGIIDGIFSAEFLTPEQLDEKRVDYEQQRIKQLQLTEAGPSIARNSITEIIESDPEIKRLTEECTELFGFKNLVNNETIVLLAHDAGMNPGVISVLLKYCRDKKKNYPRQWRKLAGRWMEMGINDVKSAVIEVERLKELDIVSDTMLDFKARIKREKSFTPTQEEFIKKWALEMDFSAEIIFSAWELAFEKLDDEKYRFKYMNTVLGNWKKRGVKTAQDAERIGKPPESTAKKKNKEKNILSFDLKTDDVW